MRSSEKYILEQPEPYREMLLYLQTVVESTLPKLELKYKYKIPFYYYKGKPFCYFNASHKKKFVDVGFWKGNQIQVCHEHLVSENRKMMVSLRYFSIADVNEAVLVPVLENAIKLYM